MIKRRAVHVIPGSDFPIAPMITCRGFNALTILKPRSPFNERNTLNTRRIRTEEITRRADILVVAAGRPRVVGGSFVKPGATVIDVGINVDESGALCGDVNFEEAEKTAGAITPVPGGVGSVTTAVLCKHVIEAAERG